ncbi:hypothetical protein GCM10010319_24170 [Streptomyces blastmyceticus]|uniref:Uncharacterized protein n=1 Tax=Streptomyces blastmyceticus TaxID=68180 RepID=A0ABN0WU85_9ACTN
MPSGQLDPVVSGRVTLTVSGRAPVAKAVPAAVEVTRAGPALFPGVPDSDASDASDASVAGAGEVDGPDGEVGA